MHKKNIKLFVIIGAILLCCFFSTIAYSALYSTMDISGIAYARVVKDVRITDFRLNSSSNATSQYEEFGVNTISSKFNLLDSSSSIIFDVEVTNYGSADVGILQLIGDIPTGLSYEIINYNLEDKLCDDTGKCNQMAVKTFQIKFTGTAGEYELTQELDFRTYHTVTYTDITNNGYPTEVIDGGDLNITFTESLKRIAVLSDGTEIDYYSSISSGQAITIENVFGDLEFIEKELVARLVSGDLNTAGSEVCIEDECFYIISNDGSTVAMLAKYNLYVGGKSDKTGAFTAYGSEATGIQNSSMIGWVSSSTIWDGTIEFSNSTQKGTNYSDYSGSLIETYVNNYGNYLTSLGVNFSNIRLINKSELDNLGCDEANNTCSSAPSWILNTSFWTGTAYDTNFVWFVVTDGNYNHYIDSDRNDRFGVRPVIELSVDEIIDPYAVGAENCFGDECFYVISSTDTTVTMLAKYNITLEDSPVQSVSAGRTVFSSDSKKGTNYSDYHGSVVEEYVNNYINYLVSQGVTIIEARLISEDELVGLGCSKNNNSCSQAPRWVYGTTYWTGVIVGSTDIMYISGMDGEYLDYLYFWEFGVRPVITVSKEYIK